MTDLSKTALADLLLEVKYRLGTGDITPADLGIAPDLAGATDELLTIEVNKRLNAGDIDADDLEVGDDDDGSSFFGSEDEGGVCDVHALDEAAARFRRREYREMLWQLEKALGAAFAGLSDLKPEHLA